MNIKWKGKIGYGDIISPICYAYNESVRRNTDVTLEFLYESGEEEKHKPQDPETQKQRIEFIVENTFKDDVKNNVEIITHFNSPWSLDSPHTNYTDKPLSCHNLRFTDRYRYDAWDSNSDYVVVMPSTTNRDKLSDLGKAWKDPLEGRWDSVINSGMNVKIVDYTTPIKEACELLQHCKFVYTYHGGYAYLARWIGAPALVYSQNVDRSDECFNNAFIRKRYDTNNITEMNPMILDCRNKLSRANAHLAFYLSNNNRYNSSQELYTSYSKHTDKWYKE